MPQWQTRQRETKLPKISAPSRNVKEYRGDPELQGWMRVMKLVRLSSGMDTVIVRVLMVYPS
jgi:hypothetical protein